MNYSWHWLHKSTYFTCLLIQVLPSTSFVDAVRQSGLEWREEEGKHIKALGSTNEVSQGEKLKERIIPCLSLWPIQCRVGWQALDWRERVSSWPKRLNPTLGSLCTSNLAWSLGFAVPWLPYCRCDGSNSKGAGRTMQTGVRAFFKHPY